MWWRFNDKKVSNQFIFPKIQTLKAIEPLTVPVLIVAFNRPDKTQRVLERVRQVQPRQLFLSIDGARPNKSGEAEKVAAVQRLAAAVDWDCEVKTLFRKENLGCRRAVSGGINWFFEHVERGIILEDDCVPHPSFFYFCEALLERYQNQENILQIAGSNLIEDYFKNHSESYVFSNFALIWGWATWRRAWQKMDVDMMEFPHFQRERLIKRLIPDWGGQRYLLDKFNDTYQKNNDSWAYAWFYTVLLNDGLTILPTQNLIQNIGIDEEATHTQAKGNALKKVFEQAATGVSFPLRHPQKIQKHDEKTAMEIFYATQKPRHLLFINKILPLAWLKTIRKWRKKWKI